MLRKFYILTLISLALLFTACADDSFSGGNGESNMPVLFSSASAPIQKDLVAGASAAELLENNFVVYGSKQVNSADQLVFDHYNVNFGTNTAGTTTSNSSDWEYVGQNHNLKTAATAYHLGSATSQTIKYWDYAADHYDFVAFSFGKGYNSKYARATAVSNFTYNLTGNNLSELTACYVSDKNTVSTANYAAPVTMQFRPLASKIRVGLYELIPGYSVKNVRFYTSDTAPTATSSLPVLFNTGLTSVYPIPDVNNSITLQVSYPTALPQVSLTTGDKQAYLSTLTLPLKARERKENDGTENIFLGRSSSDASVPTDYTSVMPYNNQNPLMVKMDFTLVARDGQGDEIDITGATAVIPEQYAQWKVGYAYTYLFKISDNLTIDGERALVPITFDAVTIEGIEGEQQTITTIEAASITTYSKEGAGADSKYAPGKNVYVSVPEVTITESNLKIYKTTFADINAITKDAIEEALDLPTAEQLDPLTFTDRIPAEESSDGSVVISSRNFAVFQPEYVDANTGYVVVYDDGKPTDNLHYKVIKVKNPNP